MSITGAPPNKPPNSNRSPAFLPIAGITRTAVVFLLIIPIAASSAIIAEIVSELTFPGSAIISKPTEQTQVIASSLSRVKAPTSTAFTIPASSETGINAPLNPPT